MTLCVLVRVDARHISWRKKKSVRDIRRGMRVSKPRVPRRIMVTSQLFEEIGINFSKSDSHQAYSSSYSLCFPGVTVNTYSCLDPGIPVHGRRYGHDFSIGSTVSFSCDPGYRLSHEEPLLCEKNHWWSHPLPTCDGKNSFNIQNKLIYKTKRNQYSLYKM